jgi:hypothetical protein
VKSDFASEVGGDRGTWSNGVAQAQAQRSGGCSTVPHCCGQRQRGVGTLDAWRLLVRLAFDCLVESWQVLRRRGWQGLCLPGPRPLDGLPVWRYAARQVAAGDAPRRTGRPCPRPRARGPGVPSFGWRCTGPTCSVTARPQCT